MTRPHVPTHRRQRFLAHTRPRATGGPGAMKRLNLYIPADAFEKIVSRAEALEVAPGVIAASIIEVWCAGEPPALFIGTDERS